MAAFLGFSLPAGAAPLLVDDFLDGPGSNRSDIANAKLALVAEMLGGHPNVGSIIAEAKQNFLAQRPTRPGFPPRPNLLGPEELDLDTMFEDLADAQELANMINGLDGDVENDEMLPVEEPSQETFVGSEVGNPTPLANNPQQVPEPGTLAVLGGALLALAMILFRWPRIWR